MLHVVLDWMGQSKRSGLAKIKESLSCCFQLIVQINKYISQKHMYNIYIYKCTYIYIYIYIHMYI